VSKYERLHVQVLDVCHLISLTGHLPLLIQQWFLNLLG